eukprot:TRINITY_DN19421_c0_g1_i1.p1 TRINITY_DN19421_c0_g1~~TRINITY_DN19421_c0_g1_i1.p1  ORF type:complete len:209 (+),score=23.39 TRINITY_DN19421_c0_g1_i1:246-872(+)
MPMVSSELPSSIPGFEVLGRLGEGHAGTVFLGVDARVEQRAQVALKSFKGKSARRNFGTELDMLAKVQGHPNVIALVADMILDSPETHGLIALEYHARGSLSHRLQEHRPTSELEASTITVEMFRALSHIHSLDVIHRDVKPENVVFNSDGRCVLIDFNIACLESDETAKARPVGTLGFMAPEVISRPSYNRSAVCLALAHCSSSAFA